MLIPEPLEKTLNFSWHLTKGVANLAVLPVRLLMNDEGLPKNGHGITKGEPTVFDVIDPMLDNATIIYFYTELRSETNKLLDAHRIKLSRTKKELVTIRNAIQNKNVALETLQAADESSPFPMDALAKYKTSLLQLEELKVRSLPNLTDGDIKVLEVYFEILSEPKPFVDIKSDIELYNKYIGPAFRISFGGTDFNLKQLGDMVGRCPDDYIFKIDDDFVTTSLNPSGFLNGFDSELVYTISVNKRSQAITVTFRGSVNANDWITNVSMAMTDLKLPGYTKDEMHDTRKTYGRVHRGFYEYLFGKTQLGDNGSNKSKSEEIMGILCSMLEGEYKGYSVKVTGHSLGGAISTLFAFRAAALGELLMVTNVSLASPYVGDQAFRDSFYELEQKNKIRHIRVSNDEDAVPLIPFVAPGLPVVSVGPIPVMENYKHVGMNIHLFNEEQMFMPKVCVFYPKMGSLPNEMRNAVLNNLALGLSVGVISKHLCPEYIKRTGDAKKELQSMTVEGLYSNVDLTGWNYTAP